MPDILNNGLPQNVNILGTDGGLINPATSVGADNLNNGQVTVITGSVLIIDFNIQRRSVVIKNLHTSIPIYVGKLPVSSSNGMELKAGESISIDFNGAIYGTVISGSVSVAYLETYE